MTTNDPIFEAAVATVLAHEGGFADHPDDPGGATKFGISLGYLKRLDPTLALELGDVDRDGDVDADDIRAMPRERAIEIYHRQWWVRYRYGQLGGVSIPIKVFDLAVNMGPGPAHKCLQRAVRAAAGEHLDDDGVLGPVTRDAVRRASGSPLLASIRSEAAGYYRSLVAERPRFACFLKGWLARAYSA